MKTALLCIISVTLSGYAYAQNKTEHSKCKTDSLQNHLQEVVLRGQYTLQYLKNSVYQTRVISAERIRLRAATTSQQVLNTELGFRFLIDLTLGISDVQLMGMSGRNVKILPGGIPMIVGSDTRESLNQIDINTVERIESNINLLKELKLG